MAMIFEEIKEGVFFWHRFEDLHWVDLGSMICLEISNRGDCRIHFE